MNNTTLLSLQQNTALELSSSYDSVGAIIYIVVVLLWYSSGIVFVWVMHRSTPNEIVEDSIRDSRDALTKNFREKTNNKKILGKKNILINAIKRKNFYLEELADQKYRDKLWDIYFGTSGDMNGRRAQSETLRIRHIQQQLTTINEHDRHDKEYSSDLNVRSSVSEISSRGSPYRVRCRSSMDQQMLEEWKTTADGLKIQQNQSWVAQRIFIQRFLRQKHSIESHPYS
jgi:hypothetical protein